MTHTLPPPAATTQNPHSDHKLATLQRAKRMSSIVIFLFFGVLGGWFSVARLDSAAVAQGVVETDSSTREVQHLEGGIVREIFVTNGDMVTAGDILLRLDPTRSAASAELFRTQLWISRARMARLQAEIALQTEYTYPADVKETARADPQLARALDEEKLQFAITRGRLDQQIDLLRSQIDQAQIESAGQKESIAIAEDELALVQMDLKNLEKLRESGLVNQTTVTALRRDELQLQGRIAQGHVEIARLAQTITGLKMQIEQAREDYRQRAADQLDITTRDARSLERDSTIAEDSLQRIEVRAPVNGTVQESILGTIGAVIRPGETILKIVPTEEEFIITARVSPNDIDSILPGSAADITFPAFQSLRLSPAEGTLRVISRDRLTDERTNTDYFEAEIELDPDSMPADIRDRMVAGMAATVILPTGARTALSYLLGPLSQRLASAMREK